MNTRGRLLRAGTALLAVASFGIIAASVAMLSHGLDLGTRTGRHLLAGALANACVSILLIVLSLIPMRRGERWAFWAYIFVLGTYGVTMFIVDATHVASGRLLATLLPQGAGLLVAVVGVALVGRALFASKVRDR